MCLLIPQAFTALLGDPGCVESLSSRRFQPNIWNLHQILPEKNGQEKALKLKGWKIWLPCRKSCHEALWINTRQCSKAGYSKERHFWSTSTRVQLPVRPHSCCVPLHNLLSTHRFPPSGKWDRQYFLPHGDGSEMTDGANNEDQQRCYHAVLIETSLTVK